MGPFDLQNECHPVQKFSLFFVKHLHPQIWIAHAANVLGASNNSNMNIRIVTIDGSKLNLSEW